MIVIVEWADDSVTSIDTQVLTSLDCLRVTRKDSTGEVTSDPCLMSEWVLRLDLIPETFGLYLDEVSRVRPTINCETQDYPEPRFDRSLTTIERGAGDRIQIATQQEVQGIERVKIDCDCVLERVGPKLVRMGRLTRCESLLSGATSLEASLIRRVVSMWSLVRKIFPDITDKDLSRTTGVPKESYEWASKIVSNLGEEDSELSASEIYLPLQRNLWARTGSAGQLQRNVDLESEI